MKHRASHLHSANAFYGRAPHMKHMKRIELLPSEARTKREAMSKRLPSSTFLREIILLSNACRHEQWLISLSSVR